jgi:multidrug efflux pump subunit AcrA (membrane-fusion protein)
MKSRGIAATIVWVTTAGTAWLPTAPAWPEAPPSPGAMVLVARAVSGCFSDTIRVTGFLVPREEALVTLDLDGYRVADILVAEGERVSAGQPLVRLARIDLPGTPDPPPASPPGRPQQSLPAAPSALPASVTLRAPAQGLVTRSSVVLGAMAALRAEPLFRIMINSELELEVEVPSIHVPKLKRDTGQSAHIEVDNGVQLGGRVRLAPAEIDRMTQLGRARISIDRVPALRVGMFARATIDASRSCGISIPRSAINYGSDSTSVLVVHGNKVESRRVRIGLLSDANVEIRDGLKEGELVVANAGSSLEDGDNVKPIFPEQLNN